MVVTVGAMLRAARQARGRSARSTSLAAGLSESVVNKIESGRSQPTLPVFGRLACELGLNDREIAVLVRLAAQASGPPEP